MTCQNCGAQLPNGTNSCPYCGHVQDAAPAYQAQYNYGNEAAKAELANQVFKWGLMGLIFSWVLGLPGIFISAKGKSCASQYISQYGELEGKAKAGSILAKIGFILGIVGTVIIAAAILFYCCYFGLIFGMLGNL